MYVFGILNFKKDSEANLLSKDRIILFELGGSTDKSREEHGFRV